MTTPIIWVSDYLRAIASEENPETVDDSLIENARELILGVSELIEDETDRQFSPYYGTRFFSPRLNEYGGDVTADGYLLLDDDLLAVTQLINNSTDVVSSDDFALFPLGTMYPSKDMIRLKNNLYWSGLSTIDNFDSVQVSGLWGGKGGKFKRKTSLTAGTDDIQETISVASFSGLEWGQVLKVGDELMLVTETPETSSVPVERAYNGSEAASHTSADPVYLYRAGDLVRRVAMRIVKWQDALDDNPLIATVTVGAEQELVNLSAVPDDVTGMLANLTRAQRIRGV